MPMNSKDHDEFVAYLKACTDAQVRGVLEKERAAGRHDYAMLAEHEAALRAVDELEVAMRASFDGRVWTHSSDAELWINSIKYKK